MHVQKCSLNQSKKLLLETDMTITDICQQCGFSDSAYFGKVFRRSFGITPGEYRLTHFWKKNGFEVISEADVNGWTKLVAERQFTQGEDKEEYDCRSFGITPGEYRFLSSNS